MKAFDIKMNTDNTGLLSLVCKDDEYQMNWIEGANTWGSIVLKDGYGNLNVEKPKNVKTEDNTVQFDVEQLNVKIVREFVGEYFCESYTFKNTTDVTHIYGTGDIGICTPFNDNYQEASVCLKTRCHTHIWCGGECVYINAIRMGGEAPHIGLVLTQGSVMGYGLRENGGNDRGDFVLYFDRFTLKPGAEYKVSWQIFKHNGDDFYEKAEKINNLCSVGAEKYTLFPGEKTIIKTCGANAYYNGKELTEDEFSADCYGEHKIELCKDGKSTFIKINCVPELCEIISKRCKFIAEKQQCTDEESMLYGAYLAYDNETGEQVYSNRSDINSARERTAMGVLLSLYLQNNKDEKLKKSLDKYISFIKKEIFDENTGIVSNDAGHNNVWHRLYNYPWIAALFLEVFRLSGEKEYLNNMVSLIKAYYENGGDKFYCIGMPMSEAVKALDDTGMHEESRQIKALFLNHIENIIKIGTDYPGHEVTYEQSIVAPAVIYIFQGYLITGDERYITEGKKHLRILELFCGEQPDYHLNNIGIRHWDGYWFGKRRMFGDTFPHYWSTLNAIAYQYYYRITGEAEYERKAETVLRNNLCLFNNDGSASCAYIYPHTVNSEYGRFYDPWANDQDWALVHAIKFLGGDLTGKIIS